jgi:hypothetical protein
MHLPVVRHSLGIWLQIVTIGTLKSIIRKYNKVHRKIAGNAADLKMLQKFVVNRKKTKKPKFCSHFRLQLLHFCPSKNFNQHL